MSKDTRNRRMAALVYGMVAALATHILFAGQDFGALLIQCALVAGACAEVVLALTILRKTILSTLGHMVVWTPYALFTGTVIALVLALITWIIRGVFHLLYLLQVGVFGWSTITAAGVLMIIAVIVLALFGTLILDLIDMVRTEFLGLKASDYDNSSD